MRASKCLYSPMLDWARSWDGKRTLPAGLRGISGRGTMMEGTKCAGRRCLSMLMMASQSTVSGLTKPTRRSVALWSFMTTAAASLTLGASVSTDSTSPSSIRKPRSFTCMYDYEVVAASQRAVGGMGTYANPDKYAGCKHAEQKMLSSYIMRARNITDQALQN